MTIKIPLLAGACCLAAALAPLPASAATVPACSAGKPTAASYTWDFKAEAARTFSDIRADVEQIATNTDELRALTRDDEVSYNPGESYYWNQVDSAINDMGNRECRLQTIRRVVSPAQQRAIDKILAENRLMAYHARNAGDFGKAHPENLLMGPYRDDLVNLYNEAQALAGVMKTVSRASA
ncbi:MAG TPA: hypothetical protein VMU19_01535 [Bryobacteraceae bacterium]|nr:hypothetical protein [Bryobacteraceae bacterium]